MLITGLIVQGHAGLRSQRRHRQRAPMMGGARLVTRPTLGGPAVVVVASAGALRIWLAELTAYNPRLGTTAVLRVASRGFTTRPSEAPASTWYDPRLTQPINIARSILSPGATSGKTRIALGDVVIANPDGALDAWIEYAFDGRAITLYSGSADAAYPSGFVKEFVGTMDYPDFSLAVITIKLRETQREMNAPVQINRYGGTNVLPAGVDGTVSDLKGKLKPLLFGRCTNITPPTVNTSLLIYQLSDLAVSVCTAVYDAGVSLTVGATYPDMATLISTAPAAGAFRFLNTPTGSYIRLGSSPTGALTADAEQDTGTPANETAGTLFQQLVTLAGTNLGAPTRYTLAPGTVAAMAAVSSAVLGRYLSPADEMTFVQLLDEIATTVGAWWGVNRAGQFRMTQLTAPSGAALVQFDKSVILLPFERLSTRDEDRGVPVYRMTCRYGRNYTVQTDGLAGSVTAARRAVVGQQYREATYIDATVQTANLLAADVIEDTLFAVDTDALAEATRRQILRGKQRHRFDIHTQYTTEVAALELGDTVSIYHARYGLSVLGSETGQLFTIIGITPDAAANRITFTLWGAALDLFNRTFEDGTLRAFEDGTFRLYETA